MTRSRHYLDHNATAPLRPEARTAMLAALDVAGNASSVHAEGRAARAIVERAREEVAALVGAQPAEVVFTSGGTEADNWVLAGPWNTIFVAGIEHDAVLQPSRGAHARLVDLPVGRNGVADVAHVAEIVLRDDGRLGRMLVTLQLANNETGVLQPVEEIAQFAREHEIAVHTDAVQAAGRVPIDVAALGAQFVSLSAHKLGGPKGVGALILREGAALPAFVRGGGQERRLRGGTENVAGIAGFGAAAVAAKREVAEMGRIAGLRNALEQAIREITPSAVIVGAEVPRLPNTSCIALPGGSSETLVIAFDLAGIAVSAGAACSSGKVSRSKVLTAMGLPHSLSSAAIRVSLGWNSTREDVDAFLLAWSRIATKPPATLRVA